MSCKIQHKQHNIKKNYVIKLNKKNQRINDFKTRKQLEQHKKYYIVIILKQNNIYVVNSCPKRKLRYRWNSHFHKHAKHKSKTKFKQYPSQTYSEIIFYLFQNYFLIIFWKNNQKQKPLPSVFLSFSSSLLPQSGCYLVSKLFASSRKRSWIFWFPLKVSPKKSTKSTLSPLTLATRLWSVCGCFFCSFIKEE